MIYGLQDDARLFFTLASAADEGMLTYELAQVTIGFCFNFSKKKTSFRVDRCLIAEDSTWSVVMREKSKIAIVKNRIRLVQSNCDVLSRFRGKKNGLVALSEPFRNVQ